MSSKGNDTHKAMELLNGDALFVSRNGIACFGPAAKYNK